jgi:hypothetical protein
MAEHCKRDGLRRDQSQHVLRSDETSWHVQPDEGYEERSLKVHLQRGICLAVLRNSSLALIFVQAFVPVELFLQIRFAALTRRSTLSGAVNHLGEMMIYGSFAMMV